MAPFSEEQRAELKLIIDAHIGDVELRFGTFVAQGAKQVADIETFCNSGQPRVASERRPRHQSRDR